MVVCPKCRSDRTAPILYGYPSNEAFEAEERGELILGGCEMIDGMPHEDYGCLDCRYRWSKELLPATQITKIRYKVVENGPCTIDSQQSWVYEIYQDGRCKEYIYQGQSRKYQFKTDEKVSEKKAYRLACSLQKIIGAPLWEKNIVEGQVCDGCSYELQITYTDKRKEVMVMLLEVCLIPYWRNSSTACSHNKNDYMRKSLLTKQTYVRIIISSLH